MMIDVQKKWETVLINSQISICLVILKKTKCFGIVVDVIAVCVHYFCGFFFIGFQDESNVYTIIVKIFI